jgi:transposase
MVPMPRITMDQQKEIQFLKPRLKSIRKVAKHLGINRETVAKYWDGSTSSPVNNSPDWASEVDWRYIQSEVRKGVSIKNLFRELNEVHKLPAYENFCRFFRLYHSSSTEIQISFPIERLPGISLEVDYSGDKMEIINPATGEVFEAELFVAALTYSSYFYAEFTLSQKLSDFIGCCERALLHIGKVPEFMVSDNCLTAVTKVEKYDTSINKMFSDFCHHYGIIPDPARVRKPKDKPVVERSIGIIQQEFFQRMRNRTFTSLFELNQELKKYLASKMNEVIKGRGKSRNQLLIHELEKMNPLPHTSFELFDYKRCKVHPDCHIRHLKNCYSVPYRYVGKDVEVKFNDKMIHIYSETDLIGMHSIAIGQGHYVSNPAHYPEDKLIDINYHINSVKQKAKKIGPNTELLIKRLLEVPRQHPLRNLPKIQSILALKDKFTTEGLEYAAEAALESNKLTYRFIQSCTKNYRTPKPKTLLLPIRRPEFVCLQGGS